MTYQYFLIAKLTGGEVVAMLNWLGLDMCQLEEGLSSKQNDFLNWLQEHSPDNVQWTVEGEYVREETKAGYTEVHEIPAVQNQAMEVGLTDKEGISEMATIMNCKISRLSKGGNWEEWERKKVTPTYPRLKWDDGRFVVEQQKKRKATAAATAAAPQKKTKTGGCKIILLNTTDNR